MAFLTSDPYVYNLSTAFAVHAGEEFLDGVKLHGAQGKRLCG